MLDKHVNSYDSKFSQGHFHNFTTLTYFFYIVCTTTLESQKNFSLHIIMCHHENKHWFLNQTSAFLIGSIEEVNRRISQLDEKLQHYTQLVVESRSSFASSSMTDIVAYSDLVRDTHKKKGMSTLSLSLDK